MSITWRQAAEQLALSRLSAAVLRRHVRFADFHCLAVIGESPIVFPDSKCSDRFPVRPKRLKQSLLVAPHIWDKLVQRPIKFSSCRG
jgi:hypothetical protein